MKKFLSLALALVMTMSLVTISAGAKDFTDDSKIKYDEAVAVVSACKIIDGYADGSFNPQGTLTRGAAAKIICNMILGPTTAAALGADAAPFSDVPANHTFAGYIAYCAQKGIINGYADGTFRPAGTLTGYAFMKMLLGALGYDGTIEVFTGANWSVNVAKLALNIGLDDGNDNFVGSAAMTREEACLYAFNTLTATMVEYKDKGSSIVVGDITINQKPSDATEVPQGSYASYKDDEEDNTLEFCEKYFSKLKMDMEAEGKDVFGRPAVAWTYDGDDVGTFADTAKYTYTGKVKMSELYSTIGKTIMNNLGDYTVNYTLNGAEGEGDFGLSADFKDDSTKVLAPGQVTEIFINKTAKVIDIAMYNYFFAEVTNVDYDKTDKEYDVDFDVYDNEEGGATAYTLNDKSSFDFEEDDYVLVTIADGDIQDVVAPTKVEGTAKIQATDYYTVDGTKINTSAVFYNNEADGDYTGTYAFYKDANGYVVAAVEVKAGEDFANYVWLKAVDVTADTNFKDAKVQAKVMFMDGKTKVVDLYVKESKLTGADEKTWNVYDPTADEDGAWVEVKDLGDDEHAIASGFYGYSVNSDGAYSLKALDAKYATQVEDFTLNDKVSASVVGGFTANSSSKMVLVDDAKTYTSYKKFPTTDDVDLDAGATALILHGKDSTTAKTVYVVGDTTAVSTVTFAFSTSASKAYTNADGDYYKFYVNGEIKYYQVAGTTPEKNAIYSMDLEDDTATLTAIDEVEYSKSLGNYMVATAETVSAVTSGDYFKTEEGANMYYFGYDEDDKTCEMYDVDSDGAAIKSISKKDVVTVVYIVDGDENYALAVYNNVD